MTKIHYNQEDFVDSFTRKPYAQPINSIKENILIISIVIKLIYPSYMTGTFALDSQLAFTYSKLTIETLEQGVQYVQS